MMRLLPLLFKNSLRNRRRTLLTVSSIAVSLFLIAALLTVLSELRDPPVAPEGALRLVTRHKVSLGNILPISHAQKIAQVSGVEKVCATQWFGGVYKEEGPWFAQFAVDAESFLQVYSELRLSTEEAQAFLMDRTGAIAARSLAERNGWKPGDRMVLRGTIFRMNPELTLRGIYEGGDQNSFYFHWDYFNEGIGNLNFAGTFGVKVKSADLIPQVVQEIDSIFENSIAPTKTETEKAFILGFVSMIGNVQLLITSICTVVIFTIILVAANSMAMSIRERVHEIGVLKSLGFSRQKILGLLIGESLLLSVTGALTGALGARITFDHLNIISITRGFLQRFYVTPDTIVICFAIGLLVGMVAAGVPAWHAASLPPAEALGRV